MTTGQMMFYAGVGLLILTGILAVVFSLKKPEYHPESETAAESGGKTAPLHNGFPTDPLTVRRDKPEHPSGGAGTAPLGTATLPLAEETVPLTDAGTAPLDEGTMPLHPETAPLDGETPSYSGKESENQL